MADYDLLHDGEEIDACIDEVVAARGSEASLSARLADIVSGFETDQQRQDDEIGAVAAMGAKNLFNIGATPAVNHTDYTLTDGKLTVSANGNWAHYSVPLNLPAGNYVLSAVISGYSRASGAPDTSMRIRMSATTSGGTNIVLQTVTGNGSMSVPFTWTGGTIYLQFYPDYNGTSYANSFAAENTMIRRAEITDDTYVPYAPTNRELYETGQQSYDFIFGLGTALNSNDDLNNYNKVGKIYAATGAIAATISNTPWTLSGFMVITIPMLTATTFIQFLLPNTSGGKWYKRRYTTGSWSAWTEYDGTQVAASQSASPASLMQAGRIGAELTDAGNDEEEEER